MTRPVVLIALGLAVAAALVLAFVDLGSSEDPYDDGGLPVEPGAETDEAGGGLRGSGTSSEKALVADAVVGKEFVHGQVLGPDGKPVAGIDVTAHYTTPNWDDPKGYNAFYGAAARAARSRDAIVAPRLDYPPESGRATTDAKGTFRIEGLRRGSYTVRAHPSVPLVSSNASASISKVWNTGAVTIHLVPGTPIRGRVVNTADEPVDAVVSVGWSGDVGGGRVTWNARPTKTDEGKGTFTFAAVPEGELGFTVTVPGVLKLAGLKAKSPSEEEIVLRLPLGGGQLSGTASDIEGTAIAGAQVTMLIEQDEQKVTVTTKTDATGLYVFTDLPNGELKSAEVIAPRFAPLQEFPPTARWSGLTIGTDPQTLDFQLLRGGTLKGVVRTDKGGTPLANAKVHVFLASAAVGYGAQAPLQTVTGPDGRFEVTGVPAGRLVLIALHETHYMKSLFAGVNTSGAAVPMMINSRRGLSPSAPAANTVLMPRNGATVEKDIELTPGLVVEGVVLDPSDQPVADAEIRIKNLTLQQALQRWGVNWWADVAEPATSDASGEFRMASLPPGDKWELYAKKEGFAGQFSDPIALKAGEPAPRVTLKLLSGGTVRGNVVDAEGRGVPGMNLNLWSNNTMLAGGRTNTTTGVDGAFEVTGLPAGTWNMWVQRMGGSMSVSHKVDDLKEGEIREGIEIKVTDSGEKVTGRLVDSKGKPVAYQSIQLSVNNAWLHTNTDSEGRFTFQNAARGKARLYVQSTGRNKTLGEPFDSPAEDLELTYDKPETHVIEGTVLDTEGQPVPLCNVIIANSGSSNQPMMPGQNTNEVVYGVFRRTVTGDGPYHIRVTNPRDAEGRSMNLAPFGKAYPERPTKPIELRLTKGKEITGVVSDQGGAGVEGVGIQAGSASTTTDSTGRFSLGGLGESVRLGISAPKGYVKPAQRTVKAGEHVEITLLTGHSVGGTASGPDGPVKQGWVNASWKAAGTIPAGSSSGQVTKGKFSIEGIPEGVLVTVSVNGPWENGSQKYAPVTIKDVRPGTMDLEVNFGAGMKITGKVLDTDGKPFTAGWVFARTQDGKHSGAMAQLQSDGSFTIGGLAPAEYSIGVQKQSGGSQGPTQKVTAPASDVVIRMPKTLTISGTLTGGETAGYRVAATLDDGENKTTVHGRTQANGTWEIADVPEGGRWIISALKRDAEMYAQSEPVAAGSTDVVLRLKKGQSIAGTVTVGGGSPGTQVWVMCQGDGWNSWTRADADGRFTVKGLPPGRYKLSSMNPTAGNARSEPIEVDAGATGISIDM